MPSRPVHQQRDLFEPDDPPIKISLEQRRQLLPLVQAMLTEIARPTANQEVGDDQGHV
jgi:hypothetical protein